MPAHHLNQLRRGRDGVFNLACLGDGVSPARIAQPGAALAGRLERSLGPLRDGLALMLGKGRQDVDGEPVGLGHVGGDELDAGLHQPGDEVNIAGQPIQLGDDQRCLLPAAQLDGLEQLGPVGVALAGFDLGKLSQQGSGAPPSSKEPADRLPLFCQSKAALALALGRNAVIGYKFGGIGHRYSFSSRT